MVVDIMVQKAAKYNKNIDNNMLPNTDTDTEHLVSILIAIRLPVNR